MGVHEDAWKGLVHAAVHPTLEHAAIAAVIAAMVMGHSIKQWDLWSDMQYHPQARMPQNAVRQWNHWYGVQACTAAMLQPHRCCLT